MSRMIKMLKKSEQDGLESYDMTPDPVARLLEAPETRRSSWSARVGWGVAAVVVLVAGPMIVERWYVKGAMTPVSVLQERTVPVSGVSQALGTIQAVSDPPGAGVLLDGRFVGVTPVRFQWGAGPATLTLKKNGFQDLIAPLQVDAVREVDFRVTLQPESVPVVATPAIETASSAVPEPMVAAKVEASSPAAKVEASSPAAIPVEESLPVPVTAAPEDGESEVDAPLKLAGVIRHPPEVRIEDARSRKSARSLKPAKSVVQEGNGIGVPVQDVRGIAKDPELAALLRQEESAPSDALNFAYSIQMSAFLDRESAIRNAALWRKRGYDAYVLELWGVKDPSRLWQSVRVGRFNDLAKARLALEALRRQEKMPGFYVARSDSFTPPEGAAPVQTAKIIPMTGPNTPARTDQASGEKERGVVAEQDAFSAASVERVGNVASPVQEQPQAVAQAGRVVSTPPPVPVLAPTPRKVESGKQESAGLEAKSAPEPENRQPERQESRPFEDVTQTGSVAGQAGNEAGYPGMDGKRADPVGKGIAAVADASAVGDRVMEARKVVALQPNVVVGVQTAKDVLPEPSAWSEGEFRAQRQTESKSAGAPPQDKVASAAPPPSQDARSMMEKRRVVTQSEVVGRKETVKVASDQAGWVERTYQQSMVKKDAGDREGEEGLLQQVVKADPGHKEAVRRLARLMVETNRGDRALELLRQVSGGRGDTSLADEDPNLAAFLAALYQRREEHWQAIDLYDALLKKYPNKGLWQMGMAISLEKVEENNNALKAYKKALASGDLNHKLQSFVRKRIEKL